MEKVRSSRSPCSTKNKNSAGAPARAISTIKNLDPEIAVSIAYSGGSGQGGASDARLDTVAAGVLCLIERGVSGLQQFFDILRSIARRDSEAQADLHARSTRNDVAPGDVYANALRQFPRLGDSASGCDD